MSSKYHTTAKTTKVLHDDDQNSSDGQLSELQDFQSRTSGTQSANGQIAKLATSAKSTWRKPRGFHNMATSTSQTKMAL